MYCRGRYGIYGPRRSRKDGLNRSRRAGCADQPRLRLKPEVNLNNAFTVLAGSANPSLAVAIARELGVEVGACTLDRFPDGEVMVQLNEPVRRKEIFIVRPTSPPVNHHLIELLAKLSIGQIARERYNRDAVLVGQTTDHGTVTAASDWDGPAERKWVRPGLPDSYEALFHTTDLNRFMLLWREGDTATEALREPRLERA